MVSEAEVQLHVEDRLSCGFSMFGYLYCLTKTTKQRRKFLSLPLEEPPQNCLDGTNGKWYLSSPYWVAMFEGTNILQLDQNWIYYNFLVKLWAFYHCFIENATNLQASMPRNGSTDIENPHNRHPQEKKALQKMQGTPMKISD